MHCCLFYARSYRHWVTDNAINETGRGIMELNSENRTVTVLQVKKADNEKQGSWRKKETEEAWQSVQSDLYCSVISFRLKELSSRAKFETKASVCC